MTINAKLDSIIYSVIEKITIDVDKIELSSSIAKRFYQYWLSVCVKDTINSKLWKILNRNIMTMVMMV